MQHSDRISCSQKSQCKKKQGLRVRLWIASISLFSPRYLGVRFFVCLFVLDGCSAGFEDPDFLRILASDLIPFLASLIDNATSLASNGKKITSWMRTLVSQVFLAGSSTNSCDF